MNAQQGKHITGVVLNDQSKEPLASVLISVEGSQTVYHTDSNGAFNIDIDAPGDYVITLSLSDFITQRVPLSVADKDLDLGSLYMERDIVLE